MTQNADHGKRHAGEVAVRVADKRFRWVPVRGSGGWSRSRSESVRVSYSRCHCQGNDQSEGYGNGHGHTPAHGYSDGRGRARETRSQTQSRLEQAVVVFGASPGTDRGPGLAVSSVICGNAITLSHITVMKNNKHCEQHHRSRNHFPVPRPSPYVSPTEAYPTSLWRAGPDPIPHQLWQVHRAEGVHTSHQLW